jgi:thiol-disulfide isomerase/thioredoxin
MTPLYGKPDFEKKVEQQKGLFVVKFWQRNCPPCDRVAEKMALWEEEYPDIKFFSVCPKDRGNWNICRKYNVMFFPTILTFKDGNLINTCEGSLPDKNAVLNLPRMV